jgi:hypothetical protein
VFCIQSAKDSFKTIAEERDSSVPVQQRISFEVQFSGNKTVPRKQQYKLSDSYSYEPEDKSMVPVL